MSSQLETKPRPKKVNYHLILFVAGDEPHSLNARKNLAEMRESELGDRCTVEIVDVMQDFAPAVKHNILVTPTLLIAKPSPGAVVIGDLSDREKVRAALRLKDD